MTRKHTPITKPITRQQWKDHHAVYAPEGKELPEFLTKEPRKDAGVARGKQKEGGFVNGLLKMLNSLHGVRVYRNNSGAWKAPNGAYIRYGIGPGGSDILGYRSVVITQSMVGQRFAQFLAIEGKQGDGYLTDAQSHFLSEAVSAGGLAFEARLEDGYDPVLVKVKP